MAASHVHRAIIKASKIKKKRNISLRQSGHAAGVAKGFMTVEGLEPEYNFKNEK
jgi:hypothetical protein